MSGELSSEPHPQGPACPTLRNSEDLHWSVAVPSPSLLPRACFLRAAPPPAWASGHMCSQGHCQQWECHTGEAGACRKLPSEVPLEGLGYTSQEASAQFSNQVEVRGPS